MQYGFNNAEHWNTIVLSCDEVIIKIKMAENVSVVFCKFCSILQLVHLPTLGYVRYKEKVMQQKNTVHQFM